MRTAGPNGLHGFYGHSDAPSYLAVALVLFAYLLPRDGRDRDVRVIAALAILTRETMVLAFVPLAWKAWKSDGWRGVARWAAVGVPYLGWSLWVRFRVGHVPFLDPATNRREAVGAPLVGWFQTLQRPLGNGQQYGLLVAALTIVVAIVVVRRTPNRDRYLAWAALASCASFACYGWAVWEFPSEALRVMLPAQVLVIAAAFGTSRPRGQPSRRGPRLGE